VYLWNVLSARLARWPAWHAPVPTPGIRRLRRMGRLLVGTWFLLALWSLTYSLTIPTALVVGYTNDDAAAMKWLREHAAPGEMLANDTFVDAGIWAPYKAGLRILVPRIPVDQQDAARSLVFANIAQLERVPQAAAAACALRVGYVYYGAKISEWDVRRFPSLAELRDSAALQEAFTSGTAVVFRVRLGCAEA